METKKTKDKLWEAEDNDLEDTNAFKLKIPLGQKEFWQVVTSSVSLGKNSYNYKILDMLNGRKDHRI